MYRGILEEHDNILSEYQAKKKLAKEYEEKGQHENAVISSWYAEGVAYVYGQLFQREIEKAKPIGYYEETKMNPMGIWKQL